MFAISAVLRRNNASSTSFVIFVLYLIIMRCGPSIISVIVTTYVKSDRTYTRAWNNYCIVEGNLRSNFSGKKCQEEKEIFVLVVITHSLKNL